MPRSGYVIDSMLFARDGRRLEGEFDVGGLPRLLEAVAESSGCVRFKIEGEQRLNGDAFLKVDVSADLVLRCQRCLEPMPYPVVFRGRFFLVAPGRDWPEDELADDTFDAIEAVQSMDLVELLEQEVLLALPIAPRHDACAGQRKERGASGSGAFAVLANLKRGA
jgi:uncharacterized protein